MTQIHHLNAGWLHAPPHPRASCHCLLMNDANGMALVDTGIGLEDVRSPLTRIGQSLIELAGFQFHEHDTAIRKVTALGLDPARVRHVLLTHADPDHTGGLADFPHATVHLSAEELTALSTGDTRYLPGHFAHRPTWATYDRSDREWYGLPARTVPLDFSSDVLLVPLFGHTRGHCGVAVGRANRWVLHVGDAYYLRAELATDDHPVSALAAMRAADDADRRASLAALRRIARDHPAEVEMFGYHDTGELPA